MLRIILFPFSLIYGLIVFLRNKFFDWGILRAVKFELPVISVGNLSVGGTGKTPHVEYLIRLLKSTNRVATLSRGYKRRSSGFILADESTSPEKIGDEAFQFKFRHPQIGVSVCEKRVEGVQKLMQKIPDLNVVLLDDAFQHRWIKPGLSILLTDFYHLYSDDYVVPSGKLREFRSGARRADIILVTKSPRVLNPLTRERIFKQLKPNAEQQLFFSYVEHGRPMQIPGVNYAPETDLKNHSILLFTGIANPYPLEQYLKDRCSSLESMFFPDHHQYSSGDISKVIRAYDKILSKTKMIVTTEKDMVRLLHPEIMQIILHLPFCYIPIEVKLHEEDQKAFDKTILDYVENNQ